MYAIAKNILYKYYKKVNQQYSRFVEIEMNQLVSNNEIQSNQKEKADKIIIGIGSANIEDVNNPIDFETRKKIIKAVAYKERFENRLIKIVPLDDFFNDTSKIGAAISVEQLKDIRKELSDIGKGKLNLGVTLYTYQLNQNILPHLEQCDVISLWTWKAKDLVDLEENFCFPRP